MLLQDTQRVAYFSFAPVAAEDFPDVSSCEPLRTFAQTPKDGVNNIVTGGVAEGVPGGRH